jgi:hypothetical protein
VYGYSFEVAMIAVIVDDFGFPLISFVRHHKQCMAP